MKGALEADAFVNAARELMNQNDAVASSVSSRRSFISSKPTRRFST